MSYIRNDFYRRISRDKGVTESVQQLDLNTDETPTLKNNLNEMADTLAFNKSADHINTAVQAVPEGN